jgi:hypothetical protein
LLILSQKNQRSHPNQDMKSLSLIFKTAVFAIAWSSLATPVRAEQPAKQPELAEKKVEEKAKEPEVKLSKNREERVMPGMKILVKKGYVDIDAKVCLTDGMLELIACTKDSKEHEALISIEPKAAHIHAALLLVGAQAGNPAMRKEVETPDGPRWFDVEPRGQEVDVYLVFANKAGVMEEHPIKKFLIKGREHLIPGDEEEETEQQKAARAFPTHTFLFVGSHVFKDGESDPIYLADESGNVISLATFGDEVLALPGVHGHDNEGLVWAVDPTHLPELDTKVILRLKPKKPEAAEAPKK